LSLTPKALARRIAREQLRDDRTLLKKVRTSLSPSKARKRSPLTLDSPSKAAQKRTLGKRCTKEPCIIDHLTNHWCHH
jgi:hypothetical protein